MSGIYQDAEVFLREFSSKYGSVDLPDTDSSRNLVKSFRSMARFLEARIKRNGVDSRKKGH
jgi:hypothetical protein